ncbi:uncharacterized protein LOC62_03G004696 [Vanrija pseudolonga]|uniref:Uncharacterized protein n=1 Tax=Vanrija pseudolonga TaxID=143232 RepID=A0AAF1BKK4_9TREE|nr:hypothetical protein LOC62_03G004696 [Vanrija pseudolonga]
MRCALGLCKGQESKSSLLYNTYPPPVSQAILPSSAPKAGFLLLSAFCKSFIVSFSVVSGFPPELLSTGPLISAHFDQNPPRIMSTMDQIYGLEDVHLHGNARGGDRYHRDWLEAVGHARHHNPHLPTHEQTMYATLDFFGAVNPPHIVVRPSNVKATLIDLRLVDFKAWSQECGMPPPTGQDMFDDLLQLPPEENDPDQRPVLLAKALIDKIEKRRRKIDYNADQATLLIHGFWAWYHDLQDIPEQLNLIPVVFAGLNLHYHTSGPKDGVLRYILELCLHYDAARTIIFPPCVASTKAKIPFSFYSYTFSASRGFRSRCTNHTSKSLKSKALKSKSLKSKSLKFKSPKSRSLKFKSLKSKSLDGSGRFRMHSYLIWLPYIYEVSFASSSLTGSAKVSDNLFTIWLALELKHLASLGHSSTRRSEHDLLNTWNNYKDLGRVEHPRNFREPDFESGCQQIAGKVEELMKFFDIGADEVLWMARFAISPEPEALLKVWRRDGLDERIVVRGAATIVRWVMAAELGYFADRPAWNGRPTGATMRQELQSRTASSDMHDSWFAVPQNLKDLKQGQGQLPYNPVEARIYFARALVRRDEDHVLTVKAFEDACEAQGVTFDEGASLIGLAPFEWANHNQLTVGSRLVIHGLAWLRARGRGQGSMYTTYAKFVFCVERNAGCEHMTPDETERLEKLALEDPVIEPREIRQAFPNHPTARTWEYMRRLRYESPTAKGAHTRGSRSRSLAYQECVERILRRRFTIMGLLEEVVDVTRATQKARLSFDVSYVKKADERRPRYSFDSKAQSEKALKFGGAFHKAYSNCGAVPPYLLATTEEFDGIVQGPANLDFSMAMIAAFAWFGEHYCAEESRAEQSSSPMRFILPFGVLQGDRDTPVSSRLLVPLWMEEAVVDMFAKKLAEKGQELEGLTDRQKVERLNPVLVPIDEASCTRWR